MNWIKRIVGAPTSDKTELPERTSTPESAPLGPLIDDDETLAGEFARARRYEQTLTIVVVSPDQVGESRRGRFGSNGNGAGGPDVLPLLAGAGLREALRESDVVCYRPKGGRFVLGLPQSGGDEARHAIVRVGELFRRHLHMDLVAGAASFPADGLTLEDLENTACGRAEPVGKEAPSVASDDVRPPRDIPPRRTRARSRGRRLRTSAPSGTPQEALGSE